jgi:translation initiation factor 6 (eIF-6)
MIRVHAGIKFENSCEVGVFARLTNAYCLVPPGASEGFYRSVGLPRSPSYQQLII